jgi:hypothetical protein
LDGSIWFTDPPFSILGNYEGHVAGGCWRVGRGPRFAILGPRTADHGPPPPPARLCGLRFGGSAPQTEQLSVLRADDDLPVGYCG